MASTEASPLVSGSAAKGTMSKYTMQVKNYMKTSLLGDVVAGMTVGSVLIPQSMAYALLAGLPPEMGLYSAMLPLIAYAIFGSSPHLAVGPVSVVCLLIAVQMEDLEIDEDDQPAAAVYMALFAGIVLCIMGSLKLGFVTSLLSHAVLSGFMTAVSFVIAIEQVDTALGFKADTPPGKFVPKFVGICQDIGKTNPYAVALSFSAGAILIAANEIQKKVPTHLWPRATTLLLMVIGTSISWGAELSEDPKNVSVVGELPTGLPGLGLPPLDGDLVTNLIPAVTTLIIVGFIESIAVAKAVGTKVGIEIDPNRELLGLGISNIVSGLSGGFASFGSLSRTPLNFMAGAKTRFAGVVTAMLALLVVLFLTPTLKYLPKPVMAAIIIVAVSKMADFKEVPYLWKVRKPELLLWVLPFFGTLLVGINEGLLWTLGLCVILVIYHASLAHAKLEIAPPGDAAYFPVYTFASQQPPPLPKESTLGRQCTPAIEAAEEMQDPSVGFCYDAGRKKETEKLTAAVGGETSNGLPVLRLQAPLFYANAAQVRNAVEVVAYTLFPQSGGPAPPKAIILNMAAVTSIDSSALHVISQTLESLKMAGGVKLVFVEVAPKVLTGLQVTGLMEKVEVYDTVLSATTKLLKEQ